MAFVNETTIYGASTVILGRGKKSSDRKIPTLKELIIDEGQADFTWGANHQGGGVL